MIPSSPDALLVRYLTDECSPAQIREITTWIAEDPANAARVEEVRRYLAVGGSAREWDVDAMWHRLRDVTVTPEPGSAPRRLAPWVPPPPEPEPSTRSEIGAPQRPRNWRIGRILLIAAAITTGGLATAAVIRGSHRAPDEPVAADRATPREYATGIGERAVIHLGDGTNVTLAATSRLRIPPDFGAHSREVQLEGEAIFDVAHDSVPFRVRAGDAFVEDVGTRFDVQAYAGDSAVVVAVAEGEVTLQYTPPASTLRSVPRPEPVMLRGGEMGTLDGAGTVRLTRAASLTRYFGWADGKLVFSDERLSNVLHTLSRWYDLPVRVPNARLGARHVTAEFSAQSPAEMVDALAAAVGAHVVHQGKIITLLPGPP